MRLKSHFAVGATFLFALLILVVSGCGLSDYEQRLDRDRKRWQQFDEANKNLEAPIEPPTEKVVRVDNETKKKEVVTVPAFDELFLRPPKGIATTAKDTDVFRSDSKRVPAYLYAGKEGFNLFVAMCKDEQMVGDSKDEKKRPSESQFRAQFQAEVCGALSSYARKVAGHGLTFGNDLKLTAVTLQPFWLHKPPELAYKHASIDDVQSGRRFLLHLHHPAGGDVHVALVFEVPLQKANNLMVKQAIEFSLKSLGIGAEFGRNRLAYDQWKRAQ